MVAELPLCSNGHLVADRSLVQKIVRMAEKNCCPRCWSNRIKTTTETERVNISNRHRLHFVRQSFALQGVHFDPRCMNYIVSNVEIGGLPHSAASDMWHGGHSSSYEDGNPVTKDVYNHQSRTLADLLISPQCHCRPRIISQVWGVLGRLIKKRACYMHGETLKRFCKALVKWIVSQAGSC